MQASPSRSKPDRTPGRRARLVSALLQPDAYAHQVDTPVRLIETHISHLFLTGRYVYKIKKPVDLGFLDFTSLEKRRRVTFEELRLNRELSPDVYLGISEVRRDGQGRYRVVDPPTGDTVGDTVEEYALRMRQLDRRHELRNMVVQGSAGTHEIEKVGAHLAAFHREARPVDPGSPHGDTDTVRKVATDNLAAVGPWAGAISIASELARVTAYTSGAIEAFSPAISRRRADGRVRDCHGDLHTENIFLEPGGRRGELVVQIIDRIDFNDRYRLIDVASDLAFLTMDLRHLVRDDLARDLLSAYLAASRDPGIGDLLPFYEVYRAMVRCKVAVLRVAEQAGGRPRRLRRWPEQAETAREYAALAARLTAAQRPLAMFVMTGVTGSGKSTVAGELAERWGIHRISSDMVRKALFGLDPHRPSDPAVRYRLYSPQMSVRTYRELVRQGAREVAEGRSVILDATFLRHEFRARAREEAVRLGVPFVLIECRVARATALARLRRRSASGASESDAGPELLARHLADYEPVLAHECDAYVVVDTGGQPADYMDRAEAELWRLLLGEGIRRTTRGTGRMTPLSYRGGTRRSGGPRKGGQYPRTT
jgi:aminoglycoside phosphotransferase family enzyme/predicted kinase